MKTVTTKELQTNRAAFLESLKHIVRGKGDIMDLSYKELRDRMMEDKYGY